MLEQINEAIKKIDAGGLASDTDANTLNGLSGSKIIGALRRLAALYAEDPNSCYLEVGVFQGLTLLSVAKDSTTLICYGIGNFPNSIPRVKIKILLINVQKS